jgi:hypothetical protein
MAVNFELKKNGSIYEFAFDSDRRCLTITTIDGKKSCVICQTKPISTLDEAKQAAISLSNDQDNTLFWHPV